MRIARIVLLRLGAAVTVVWIVSTAVFFALRSTGDPLEAIMGGPGSQASDEAVAQATADYGLDQPLFVQYVLQLWRIFTFNLGDSYAKKQPVGDLVMAQVPSTVTLAVFALLIAWVMCLVGTYIVAVYRGRGRKAIIGTMNAVEITASVTPQFWLGAVLIVVFSTGLGLFPATSSGMSFRSLALPVVTLAIPIAGFLSQTMREGLLAADGEPFATTARSRGASEQRVLFRHTLRHASLPGVALSSWAFGSLLSGAVVVESLFARPGLGRLLIDATLARDVPLVIGAVVTVTWLYLIVLFVADVIESVLDPRLRTVSPLARSRVAVDSV